MDRTNGLAHFYVNNSTVSVSGTTSAAGLPYQITFATAPADQWENGDGDETGYAPYAYDNGLADLIDRNYYNQHIQLHHNQTCSDTSPFSTISTAPGDDDDPNRPGSTDPPQSGEFAFDQHHFGLTGSMAPTAIVDSSGQDHRAIKHDSISKSMNGGKHKKLKNPQLAVQQRRQANLRERRRMKSINHAFDGLRQKIPTLPYEKKLSKVDTLKLAINYIQFLQELIEVGDEQKTGGVDGEQIGGEGEGGQNRAQQTRGQRSNQSKMNSSNNTPTKKVIIECRTAFSESNDETADAPPLRGHSLSWSRVGDSNCHSYKTAKVWRPQTQQIQSQDQVSN